MRFLLAIAGFVICVTGVWIDQSYDWKHRLYTPTQISKIDDLYFIVDCWHNRVLYNSKLDPDIAKWKTLDENLAGPHSIASDGELFVVDDTGHHKLKTYLRLGNDFLPLATVDDVGERPHYVLYDRATEAFYVIGSFSQTISKLKREGKELNLLYTKHLTFLNDSYTRSMSIIGGEMYFVNNEGRVFKASYTDDSYSLKATYRMPKQVESLNHLFKSEDYFYLTVSPQEIIRAKSLEDLHHGEYEDVFNQLQLTGTPYYLSQFDGRIHVPQIIQYSGLVSFTEKADEISDVRHFVDFGIPTRADLIESKRLPK